MANRRISELQELAGIDLADNDLFTVVDSGEVDPAIKNKKLTISGTKAYLNIFYLPRAGGTISGSLDVQSNTIIQGNLTVNGATSLNSLVVVSGVTFVNATVQNNLTVSGLISGNSISGNSLNVAQITGVNGVFGTQLSGATITGNTIRGTSGIFQQISVENQTVNANLIVGGNETIGGTLAVTGVSTFQSNVRVTGTLSGTTVTGTTANFTTVSGSTVNAGTVNATVGNFTNLSFSGTVISGDLTVNGSGLFNAPSGATPTLISSGVISGDAGLIIRGTITVLP